MELRARLAVGEIDKLQLQVEFVLEVNGGKVASYVADFVYQNMKGLWSVKSAVTRRISDLPVIRRNTMPLSSSDGWSLGTHQRITKA
jgi:hypothetical protein